MAAASSASMSPLGSFCGRDTYRHTNLTGWPIYTADPRAPASARVSFEFVSQPQESCTFTAVMIFTLDMGTGIIIHGCAARDHRTPEHWAWTQMRARCRNPKCPSYKNYGGRGISVCPRWDSFAHFLVGIGPRPSDKHSLDRIDNDGDYEPGNVRWATRWEQQRNMRTNVLLTARGETLVLFEWARRLDVEPSTIQARLKRGWPVEDAVTFVPDRHRPHRS